MSSPLVGPVGPQAAEAAVVGGGLLYPKLSVEDISLISGQSLESQLPDADAFLRASNVTMSGVTVVLKREQAVSAPGSADAYWVLDVPALQNLRTLTCSFTVRVAEGRVDGSAAADSPEAASSCSAGQAVLLAERAGTAAGAARGGRAEAAAGAADDDASDDSDGDGADDDAKDADSDDDSDDDSEDESYRPSDDEDEEEDGDSSDDEDDESSGSDGNGDSSDDDGDDASSRGSWSSSEASSDTDADSSFHQIVPLEAGAVEAAASELQGTSTASGAASRRRRPRRFPLIRFGVCPQLTELRIDTDAGARRFLTGIALVGAPSLSTAAASAGAGAGAGHSSSVQSRLAYGLELPPPPLPISTAGLPIAGGPPPSAPPPVQLLTLGHADVYIFNCHEAEVSSRAAGGSAAQGVDAALSAAVAATAADTGCVSDDGDGGEHSGKSALHASDAAAASTAPSECAAAVAALPLETAAGASGDGATAGAAGIAATLAAAAPASAAHHPADDSSLEFESADDGPDADMWTRADGAGRIAIVSSARGDTLPITDAHFSSGVRAVLEQDLRDARLDIVPQLLERLLGVFGDDLGRPLLQTIAARPRALAAGLQDAAVGELLDRAERAGAHDTVAATTAMLKAAITSTNPVWVAELPAQAPPSSLDSTALGYVPLHAVPDEAVAALAAAGSISISLATALLIAGACDLLPCRIGRAAVSCDDAAAASSLTAAAASSLSSAPREWLGDDVIVQPPGMPIPLEGEWLGDDVVGTAGHVFRLSRARINQLALLRRIPRGYLASTIREAAQNQLHYSSPEVKALTASLPSLPDAAEALHALRNANASCTSLTSRGAAVVVTLDTAMPALCLFELAVTPTGGSQASSSPPKAPGSGAEAAPGATVGEWALPHRGRDYLVRLGAACANASLCLPASDSGENLILDAPKAAFVSVKSMAGAPLRVGSGPPPLRWLRSWRSSCEHELPWRWRERKQLLRQEMA